MTKYQKYFQEMMEQNKAVFEEFKRIHDEYVQDPDANEKEFNEKGKAVVEIIREYELRLTSKSEGGQYGKYSSNLADKFWEAVRGYYPKIDFVGVESA